VGVGDDVIARIGRGGGFDLALGFGFEHSAALVAETLFREHLVCVVADNHPRMSNLEAVNLDNLRAEEHILITPEGHPGDLIDAAFLNLGVNRRIVLRVSHAATAAIIVGRTDLVLTLPSRLAKSLQRVAPVRVLAAPKEVPEFDFELVYHAMSRLDPAHAWLRGIIAEIADGA
jgi:DNA-binding transcriptional LysR family regulator